MSGARSTRRITPEQLDRMVELIPQVSSLRDIATITGIDKRTVRQKVAPFLAIMKLNGTHPRCGCGRDRFHPGGCSDTYLKGGKNPIPGHSPAKHAAILAKRQRIISMLIDGDKICDIAAVEGVSASAPGKYLRFLTEEQRAQRDRNRRVIGATLSTMEPRNG